MNDFCEVAMPAFNEVEARKQAATNVNSLGMMGKTSKMIRWRFYGR